MDDVSARTERSIGIAIVNWNAGAQLRRCLDAIATSAITSVELTSVVIVDNASTDGSIDALTLPPGITVDIVRNERNRGFAAACNQAASRIAADFILFLNPDAVLEEHSIEIAASFLMRPEHASIGILGIQLVDEHGHVARSCARFPTVATMLAKTSGVDRVWPRMSYVMAEWPHNESREVDHVIGAFYLIRDELFRQLHGFDEEFFVYLEDLDLSLRARQAGWRSYFLATARAFHKGGGTSEQIKSTRLFYSLRSRLIYARKHFAGGAAALIVISTLWVEPLVRLAACLVGRSPTGVGETLTAYRQLWRHVLQR